MSLVALARMLGIKPHQAEDALHSEHAARAVLSRRDLFAAGGAMAAGSAFSFAPPPPSIEFYGNLFATVARRFVHDAALSRLINGATEETDAELRERFTLSLREELAKVRWRATV